MRIAEGDISDWNAVADFLGNGHVDGIVGKGGASNRVQGLVSDHQLVVNLQALADRKKRLALALLGALPVADVDRGRIVVACRQRGANAGVHAATEQNELTSFLRDLHLGRLLISYTPLTAGSQMNLC